MKKIISVLLVSVLMLTALCGCNKKSEFALDGHTWSFTVMQDEGGGIIACSPETQELNPGAVAADFTAEATEDTLTLADDAAGESYDLTYELISEDTESAVYSVIDAESKSEGLATVAVTEYEDGSSEYTLIVTLNGLSVYFVEAA